MRSALTWDSPWGSKVLIEAEPLDLLDRYHQNQSNKPEAGGILLGYRRGDHLHVTMATTPQPNDWRQRFLFKRSASYHQEVALRQWRSSDMTMDYLGEWHTHPEAQPNPSLLDLNEWRKIYTSRPNPMLFVILGWHGEIWLGVSNDNKITKCIMTNPHE